MSGWLAALLLLLQGAYSLCFQACAARELAARFGGSEICYAALLLSALAWTAAGCAASSFSNRRRGKGSKLLATLFGGALPLAALSSLAFAASGPPLLDPDGSGLLFSISEMLVYGLLSPLLMGLVNGALFGAICGLQGKSWAGRSYAFIALGATLGGMAFSLLLSLSWAPMSLLSLLGMTLPLAAFIAAGRTVEPAGAKILCGLACVIFMALASLLGRCDAQVAALKWEKSMPGSRFSGALETRYGRYEFLYNENKAAKQLSVCRNGAFETSAPRDMEPDFPAALFAVAQPDRGDISVLLICQPFSAMPSVLCSLSAVSHVELLCPDASLAAMALKGGMLEEKSSKFSMTVADPRKFLEGTKRSYDLILSLWPPPATLEANRLCTEELFKAAAARLKPGGAFVCRLEGEYGYTADSARQFNGTLCATLRKAFSNLALAPGRLNLAAAGNSPSVSASYDELDERIAREMPNANSFPPGLLGLIVSQDEQKEESRRILQSALGAQANKDLSPALTFLHMERHAQWAPDSESAMRQMASKLLAWASLLWKEALGGLIGVYLLLRYFLSWKMSRKMAFLSFENGFYALGLTTLLIFIFQVRCGSLYRDFPAILAALACGACAGALIPWRGKAASTALKALSIALPPLALALPLLPWDTAFYGVFALLFAGGLSTGASYVEFNIQADSEHSPGFLWSAELLGGSFAVALTAFLLLPEGGGVACAACIAASRLPSLLGK